MLKVRVILWVILGYSSLLAQAQKRPDPDQLYEQGLEKLNEEKYEEAIALLNLCIHEVPAFAEAYAARAEAKEQLNDLSGAMIDYALCVELLPDQYDPLFSLAMIRYKLKLYDLAREDFLQLKDLDPGVTNRILYRQTARGTGTDKIMTAQGAMQSYVFNYLGLIETQLKNCVRGIHYLDTAIQINPEEADYYVNRAFAKKACKDPTFDQDFKRALAIDPHHSLTKHNMAVQSTNTHEQTEAQLTAIIQGDSTLRYPFVARGYFRLTAGNYSDAIDDYTRALAIQSDDPQTLLNRGMAREKLNDLIGAFSDYTQAIELQETFANAWVNRANVLLKQSRFEDAIQDYTIALLHQPDYGYAYLNRALAKHYSTNYTDACADLLQAEQLGVTIENSVRDEICKK